MNVQTKPADDAAALVAELGRCAREAAIALRNASTGAKNRALSEAARLIRSEKAAILAANAKDMDAAKAARQKGDTAAFRSNMAQAHQVMQNASFRTQEQAEIRAILTPEQQAKFDAHAKDRAEGGHKAWGHKGKGEKPATK